jgi:hypothetical protein
MPFQTNCERKPGYLHLRVTGDNSPESVAGYLAEIRRKCQEHQCPNVLVEEHLTGPSLKTLAVFETVSAGSEQVWPAIGRIAFVDTNPAHDRSVMQFAETVAVNRGVPLRVFATVDDAVRWMEFELAHQEK